MSKPWKADKEKLKNIARSVIEDVFAEEIIELRSIVDLGEVNYTLFVKTSKRPLIVRLNGEDGIEKFQTEKWASERAKEIGIPTPPFLHLCEVEGVAVTVLTYVEGINGKIHPEKTMIWEQLGKYAKRLHSINVKGFGDELIDQKAHQFKDSWQRFVQYNIDSLNSEDKLIELGVIDIKTSQKLKETFINLFSIPLRFGLCHGDISEKNTIIDPQGKVWLIDWGCVHAQAVPYFDLWSIIDWNVQPGSAEFDSFLQGYGLTNDEFNGMYPKLVDFALLETTDKLRWAIDKKPEKIQSFSSRLKKKLKNRFG